MFNINHSGLILGSSDKYKINVRYDVRGCLKRHFQKLLVFFFFIKQYSHL